MFLETARAWPRNRALWALIVSAVAVAAVLANAQTGEDWGELLAAEGIERLEAVRWLVPPGEGEWGTAVAEAVPEALEGEPAEGRHDIVVFDGMLDGAGQPHRVRRVGNLTRTPHADDRVLDTRRGQLLATVAVVDGVAVTVDLFDLGGDPQAELDHRGERRGSGDLFKIRFANLQTLGRVQGVRRVSYRLVEPRPDLSGRLDDAHLSLQSQGAYASVSLGDFSVVAVHERSFGIERQSEELVLESWIQFAVNRLRAEPWFGSERIALLEKYVFDRKDQARTAWFAVVGADNSALEELVAPAGAGAMPDQDMPAEEAVDVGPHNNWPPTDVVPPGPAQWGFQKIPGEGRWSHWAPEWARHRQPKGRPWPVVRTSVRVNERKPSDHVTMIAMDMRQLELHLEAGTANPRSTTGLRGTGQVPRDPQTLSRLLIGFNGGFKTSHGAYGLLLNRRLFVPVKPAMATIAFFEDGAVRMGTWPGEAPLGHYRKEHEWQIQVARVADAPQPPPEVVSLRQNLPPLVSGSQLNPGGARRWGGPVDNLSHTSTPRSGVCVAPPNTLVYVWGHSTSASDIGQGMILAGCEYGMHLDMNPYHTGMSMYDVPLVDGKIPPERREEGPEGTRVEEASRLMSFDTHRYVAREVKDFFYVLRRRLLTDRVGPPPPGMPGWSSRGLPVAMGLTPLAAMTRSDDGVLLLALDASMSADAAVTQGSVRVSWESASPVPLLRDGAWVSPLPTANKPVVRGLTRDGDIILVACDGCGLNRLMEVLGPVPLVEADIVGTGGMGIDGWDAGAWQSVSAAPYPTPEPSRLTFTPAAVVAPVATTDFTP